jgi:hypothetical protein
LLGVFISVPSTDTTDKRIPHLIGQVTQKNTYKRKP